MSFQEELIARNLKSIRKDWLKVIGRKAAPDLFYLSLFLSTANDLAAKLQIYEKQER